MVAGGGDRQVELWVPSARAPSRAACPLDPAATAAGDTYGPSPFKLNLEECTY